MALSVTEPRKTLGPPTYVLVPNTLDSHAGVHNSSACPILCISFTSPKSVHPISHTLHTIEVKAKRVTIIEFTFTSTM
jgi:hypothetical protein